MFPNGMKWGRVLDVHSMAWKKMVRTAHPTARSIHLTDFSCFEAPPRGWVQVPAKPPPYTPCGCEIRVQKGSTPQQHGSTCGRVRRAHQEKSSVAALAPMFADYKAVQTCLALQADIRRAISFASPAALAKFAKQKKADLSREQYDWLQKAVASRP